MRAQQSTIPSAVSDSSLSDTKFGEAGFFFNDRLSRVSASFTSSASLLPF